MASSVEWVGDQYALHNQPQREWALDLIRRQLDDDLGSFTSGEVLDLGCGDGSLSAWIASNKLPAAHLVGADPSVSQIEYARKHLSADVKNLTFEEASATEMPDEWRERFEAVLSFTALHWVRDHPTALHQIKKVLKPRGVLAFTLVLADPVEFDRALESVTRRAPWAPLFVGFEPDGFPYHPRWARDFVRGHHPKGSEALSMEEWSASSSPPYAERHKLVVEAYHHLLQVSGFEALHVAVHQAQSNSSNEEAMRHFVAQWLPHKRQVPADQQNAFVADVVRAFLHESGQLREGDDDADDDGGGGDMLHIRFRHLQVKARRVESS